MKETHRFFDRIGAEVGNIYCYDKVGDVTLMVTAIDLGKQNAMVTLNPNITEFQRAIAKPFMGGRIPEAGFLGLFLSCKHQVVSTSLKIEIGKACAARMD